MSRTWWGRAWLDAVESIAGERRARLARGRTLARRQSASDLRIGPGGANAWVDDGGADPPEVFVGLRRFRDDEWDAVLDAIAAKAAHAAALLDGVLDPGVVDDAAAVEVDLLPRPRDLHTVCTCPDDAEPCAHAAAVCHLLADALDDDPFVLLLLRGRRRDEILDEVRRRRRAEGATPAPGQMLTDGGDRTTDSTADTGGDPGGGADPMRDGVDAVEAWARPPAPPDGARSTSRSGPAGGLAQRPSRPRSVRRAGTPHALAADAARRAWEMCVGGTSTGLELTERADVARRALATTPVQREDLALRTGIAPVELAVLAAAWEFGEADGVRANDEPRWTPPPLEMARARDLVCDVGHDPRRVHVSGNRVTAEGRVQYRRSRDGRWYVYSKESGRWAMAGSPEQDIEDLLV